MRSSFFSVYLLLCGSFKEGNTAGRYFMMPGVGKAVERFRDVEGVFLRPRSVVGGLSPAANDTARTVGNAERAALM